MRPMNRFEKFIDWFKNLFISKKKQEENSNKAKREMCAKVVQSGYCPRCCELCAWNVEEVKDADRT